MKNELMDLVNQIAKQNLNDNQIEKIITNINLVLNDKNQFYDLEYLINWIESSRKNATVKVSPKPIKELSGWCVDNNTGEIFHQSGEFFRVVGVSIQNSAREVSGWDQPLVFQKEMGVLGIIRTKFNGIYHYLLNAKFEPGNTLEFQISPTLQATYSNLKKAHGGRKPRYCEFFLDESKAKVIYKKWLAEDGGRFYQKSNLNMLIEVDANELGEIPEEFKWFTLSQIKDLLQYDNYINPHVRGILCHI